jgi:arginine deiminase
MVTLASPAQETHPWGVDSETAPLRHVLMCAPDHFTWTPNANAIARSVAAKGEQSFDLAAAKKQHHDLCSTLQANGACVHRLAAIASQPSQAFTRDPLIMTPWGAIVALMQAEDRRGEYAAVIAYCRSLGIPIWNLVTDGSVEGGDVHIVRPGKIVIGYSGLRTTLSGAKQVSAWFAAKGWASRLVYFDPHFLHLDVLFCAVNIGSAIICSDVLDPPVVADLVEFLEIHNVAHATYRQAMQLGCNALSLGNDKILMHKAPELDSLVAQLNRFGILTLQTDLAMFVMDGGGPHCLTMPLHREKENKEVPNG